MAFIVADEQGVNGSYRLVNLDQVITAEFEDVKNAEGGSCVLHMSDKRKITLVGKEMRLAFEAMRLSNIHGYERSAHAPR